MTTRLFKRYQIFEEKEVKAIERSHNRALVKFRAVGIVLTAFLLLFLAQTAAAQPTAMPTMAQTIFPTSYDMRNSHSENFAVTGAFLDRSYNGSGDPTQPGSLLSGGLGDLADGIIATQNWFDVEPAPPANGPYVGWDRNKPQGTNPTITFNFGCTANIESVTVHADDASTGGVSTPLSVDISIGGSSESFAFPDPPGTDPVSATFSLSLNPGTSLTLTVNHKTQWVFLSEVTFEGSCQPVSVEIDIKPGSDPNSWPCKKENDGIPVAVLSTDTFDATSLDADSVHFGRTGTEAAEVHKKDGKAKRHVEDVNKDGLPDMVFHFRFGDTDFSCDDIPTGEKSVILTASLTGTTTDGTPIEGAGSLRLVKE